MVIDYTEGSQWITAQADGGGHYEFVFETHQSQFRGVNALGTIRAWRDDGQYEAGTQLIPSGTADIVKNLRLRRLRTIAAGESITITTDSDSSLCFDWDSDFSLTERCETVLVVSATAALLTVQARPAGAGGVIPTLENSVGPVAPGTIAFPVQAGVVSRIRVRTPTERAPQRYVISTSAQ